MEPREGFEEGFGLLNGFELVGLVGVWRVEFVDCSTVFELDDDHLWVSALVREITL